MAGLSIRSKRAGVAPWVYALGDLGLTVLALWLADVIRRAVPLGREIAPGTVYLTPAIYLIVLIVWPTVFLLFDVYSASPRRRVIEEIRTLLSALSLAALLFAGAIYFTRTRDFSRLLTAYFFLLDLFFLLGWRWLLRVGVFLLGGEAARSRVLIVGNGPTAIEVARRIQEHPWAGWQIAGFLRSPCPDHCQEGLHGPLLGDLEMLPQIVCQRQIDCVILALSIEQAGQTAALTLALQGLPVRVYIAPDYVGIVSLAPKIEDLYGVPLIELAELRIAGLNRILKRLLDLLVAGLALIILLPLGAAIAIAIKLDSPGPIFFVQERVGQNGRRFKMYKFRSMVADAPARLEALLRQRGLKPNTLKLKDDPRITRVGRLLRRASLDELPQFFNILLGDMSLVGPRPEEPRIVETYDAWHRKRLSVKPGLTGPMQVNERSDLPLDDRVRLELDYIQRYSLLEDLRLLAKTLPAVIAGKGAR